MLFVEGANVMLFCQEYLRFVFLCPISSGGGYRCCGAPPAVRFSTVSPVFWYCSVNGLFLKQMLCGMMPFSKIRRYYFTVCALLFVLLFVLMLARYRLEAHASGVTFDRCGMAVALCRHYRSGLSRRQPAQDERERNGRRDRTQRLNFSCRSGGGFGRFRTLGTTVDMLPSAGNRNRFKTGSSMDILASLEIRRVSGSELPQRLLRRQTSRGKPLPTMWTAAGVTAPFSPDAWSANMFCSTPGRLRRRW